MGDILFIDSPGYKVGKSGMKIVVNFSDGERIERSVLTFSSLVLGGTGSISTSALKLLADYNIPVVFVNSSGAYATLHPFFMHGTVIVRREQMLAYLDKRGVELSKAFVTGALANKEMVLRYLAKNREDSSFLLRYADDINRLIERIKTIEGERVDNIRFELMGLEGEGARLYFEAISRILPKELGFNGRNRRPPRDPVNAMLSYGYIILNGIIALTVAKIGLEPFAGFLHVDRSGRPSLVLDLSEEFRQPIVDLTVIPMFSREWLKIDDFEFLDSGAVLIGREGKRKFFNKFKEKLGSKTKYKGVKTTFEGAILMQTRDVARFLLGRIPKYDPFIFKWW